VSATSAAPWPTTPGSRRAASPWWRGSTTTAPRSVLSTELPALVAEKSVTIGVVATPPSAAQEVTDRLVAAGVTSILNFAPTVLTVPEGVSLRKVDLALELQILSFYQQHRDALPPSSPTRKT